jgi:hypothetical protein
LVIPSSRYLLSVYRFTDITEDLALVVVFAPPYGSRAPR